MQSPHLFFVFTNRFLGDWKTHEKILCYETTGAENVAAVGRRDVGGEYDHSTDE